MKNSKKRKSVKNNYFFRIAWFVLVCLVSVLLSRFIMTGVNDMLAVGKTSDVIQVELKYDSSLDEMAQILVNENVITEKWFFKIYALATKSPKMFSAGTYELEANMDYQSIINHMKNRNNARDVVELTVTEGMNVLECAELLDKNEICSKEEFLKYCNSDKFDDGYTFLKDISNSSKRVYRLEGYLFPDTYKFYKGEECSNVITKFLNNYRKKIYEKSSVDGFDSKVSVHEIADSRGLSIDDVINLASLIQAEAANKEDMHKVSSVINNRLATTASGGKNRFGEFSMHFLRIDATVYYPYRNEESVPSDLKKRFSSSYNTYKVEGLPPGPICNPGLDAIYAALFPSQTDYYYYCHSSSGETFFARTNEVHISNLKKAGLT